MINTITVIMKKFLKILKVPQFSHLKSLSQENNNSRDFVCACLLAGYSYTFLPFVLTLRGGSATGVDALKDSPAGGSQQVGS